jgi:RecJ-like exonuclease
VLALGGLALLWFTATHIKIPVVRISDINARMNNAVVEVKGKVTKVSTSGRDGIFFTVDDGSGEVRASAFRGLEKMRETGNVPVVGDEVSVVGNVQVTERYGTSLMINIPTRVKVTPKALEEITIDKVTLANKGKAVEVVGEIVAIKRFKTTTILVIGDATGTTDSPIFGNEIGRIKDVDKVIRVGNEIKLKGSVDEYRGRPQIKARDVAEIEVLKKDTIPTKDIPGYEKIREDAGKWAKPGAPREKKGEGVKPAVPSEAGEDEAESQPSAFF